MVGGGSALNLVPVLLGAGERLFENVGAELGLE
jgi:hypothetical protein